MPLPQITRTDVIIVDTIGTNDYGDLNWTDKSGKEYKVSADRKKYFENVIKPDQQVKLSYATSRFNKEFIYRAEPTEEKNIGKTVETTSQAPQPISIPIKTETNPPIKKEDISPQERGMWFKELGQCIRSGELPKDTPAGKVARMKYYPEMQRVLGQFDKSGLIIILKAMGVDAQDFEEKK